MLRFVLRSETKLPLIQREFAGLLEKLPQLEVVECEYPTSTRSDLRR